MVSLVAVAKNNSFIIIIVDSSVVLLNAKIPQKYTRRARTGWLKWSNESSLTQLYIILLYLSYISISIIIIWIL